MNPILIELAPDMPGFDHFIGSWVCIGRQNVLVDVGPSNTAARLITGLKTMGVERVDIVLITHIHLDHAGGLGALMENYPMAKIICHDMGITHLVDPSKLWEGSRKVLGRVAENYGPLIPLEREMLISHRDARVDGLEIIETPGHAPHHLSFRYKGHLFPGEAGGNYFTLGDTDYMRPATPPLFFMDKCLDSIDQLLRHGDGPIFYPHFGRAERAQPLLERHREQLFRWRGIIASVSTDSEAVEQCLGRLLEEDPDLRAFPSMTREAQERERYFMTNSVAGFLGHLEGKK
jgi:glyoxylase-like metal-dependent hydrolase (beta-lactamase superfamily II)